MTKKLNTALQKGRVPSVEDDHSDVEEFYKGADEKLAAGEIPNVLETIFTRRSIDCMGWISCCRPV